MRKVVVLALAITASSPAPAGDYQELAGLLFIPPADASPGVPLPAAARHSAAGAFGRLCATFQAKVLPLSPREHDWLESQLRGPVASQAMHSPEYSRQYLTDLTERCGALARRVSNEGEPNGALQFEIALWGQLVSVLLDEDFEWHVQNLQRAGTVSFTADDILASTGIRSAAQAVYDRIILQYLLGPYVKQD